MSINFKNQITTQILSIRRTPLGKKIKKTKNKKFPVFASVAPGFSHSAFKEAKLKIPSLENLHITKGGVSFNSNFEDIIKANVLLGIPSKILLRLAKFRVFNFNTLENQVKKIPFEIFLFKNSKIKISASSRKSKLIHTKAIEEAMVKGIKQRLEINQPLESPNPTEIKIQIRISRDNAVISMDSSGEHLYKRGLKTLSCHAPIRENLAFAGLFNSGYNGSSMFFDPMCGSGTFSGEASIISSNTPPGIFRNFAFENWPLFDIELYKKIISEEKRKIIRKKETIFASDINYNNVLIAKKNFTNTEPGKNIRFFCSNFFDLKKQTSPGTIAINPPYGIRVEKEKNFLKKLRLKLRKDFYKFTLVLTIPKSFQDQYFTGKNFDCIPFVHGGIEMNLVIGKIE
ncbi:MAG: hypothetical protein RBR53_00945 [Desulforegulaceae bacterium]|nr:hypothetical protein [Desulforegulaceae bacterium]